MSKHSLSKSDDFSGKRHIGVMLILLSAFLYSLGDRGRIHLL